MQTGQHGMKSYGHILSDDPRWENGPSLSTSILTHPSIIFFLTNAKSEL
jgi:hypothetical protein